MWGGNISDITSDYLTSGEAPNAGVNVCKFFCPQFKFTIAAAADV